MGFISKTLAQATPGPVLTTIYTTPHATTTTATVVICNQGVFADTYRVSVAVDGASDNSKQYLAYDTIIEPNATHTIKDIYLRSGDQIRAYASVSAISFVAFGTEGN